MKGDMYGGFVGQVFTEDMSGSNVRIWRIGFVCKVCSYLIASHEIPEEYHFFGEALYMENLIILRT